MSYTKTPPFTWTCCSRWFHHLAVRSWAFQLVECSGIWAIASFSRHRSPHMDSNPTRGWDRQLQNSNPWGKVVVLLEFVGVIAEGFGGIKGT